jgi:hypothetical protein
MSIEDKLDRIGSLLERLIDIQLKPPVMAKVETMLNDIAEQRAIKDFYTVGEVAKIVERSENQVRRWCVQGRIKAAKRACGRGNQKEWMISHEDLTAYRSVGLLPSRDLAAAS